MNDADFNKLSEAEKKHFYRCDVCGQWVDSRQPSEVAYHKGLHVDFSKLKPFDFSKASTIGLGEVPVKKPVEGGASADLHGAILQGGITPKHAETDDDDDEKSSEAPRWVPAVKTICEVIKTVGLLAVGFWAVYTYWAKKEGETAVTQYQILQLQSAEAKKKAQEMVTAKIRPESIEKLSDGYVVVLSLQFANKGGADYDLDLDDQSICLARVEFNEKNGSPFVERQFSPIRNISGKAPETGVAIIKQFRLKSWAEQARYLCFFHVKTTGVYYAEFKAHYGNDKDLLLSNACFRVGPDPGNEAGNPIGTREQKGNKEP